MENWGSEIIAERVCAVQGHDISGFGMMVEIMCAKCGLTLDQIRAGHMELPQESTSAR